MANKSAKYILKHKNMVLAKNNKNLYLATNNRKFQNFAKPLFGYIDEKTEKSIKKVHDLCFTGFKETAYFRSEKLNEMRKKAPSR